MPAPAPDARFARLQTDPRFRRPKQKALKVEIDERFRGVLEGDDFGGKGGAKSRVDKRGRALAATHEADQLKRFYRLRSPSPSASGSGSGARVDYARGEAELPSSGSEDGGSDSEADVDELEIGGRRGRLPRLAALDSEDDEDEDEDGEEDDEASDSDSEAGDNLRVNLSEDEDDDAFPELPDDEGSDGSDAGPPVEPTRRLAAVNLDWDNLRASDLYSVFASFLRATGKKGEPAAAPAGRLLAVKIYPSEFGKARMKDEDEQGPGGGIFVGKAKKEKKAKRGQAIEVVRSDDEADDGDDDDDEAELDGDVVEDDEDDADEADEADEASEYDGEPLEIVSDVETASAAGSDDVDMDALRQYQLDRLRYYYAVATFSTVAAAQRVMDECDGTEFERTANVLDLSYVPDGMEFDEDEIRDEATRELKGYKGNDFVTDALRHSKVKLTWDQDDPNRSKLTRRPLTRDEIEEQDFGGLIASSGSEDGGDDDEAGAALADARSKKAARKARTERLRALLLAGDDDAGDIWGKAGLGADGAGAGAGEADMEITFRAGLTGKAKGGAGGEDEDLTTLEKYQRRVKEKKARKKEERELRRADDAKDGKGSKGKADKAGAADKGKAEAARGGDDDEFFGDDESAPGSPARAGDGDDASDAGAASDADAAGLIDDDARHFSMKDIARAEKAGAGKRKRVRKGAARKAAAAEAAGRAREPELGPQGWAINVKDPRFRALHEEADFAIDPSNPAFTKTQAMKDLLAERAKVRAGKRGGADGAAERPAPAARIDAAPAKERDLGSLVDSVKRKMGDGAARKRKRSKK